jgi:hypothetical protein
MMRKKIKSILEELESLPSERDKSYLVENRANNAINNAIRILEQFDDLYPAEQAEAMTRKFLNAIKSRNPDKFSRFLRNSNDSED